MYKRNQPNYGYGGGQWQGYGQFGHGGGHMGYGHQMGPGGGYGHMPHMGGGYGHNQMYGGEGDFSHANTSDCIFISGLPSHATKEDLEEHFTKAGKIRITKDVQRIFLFYDQNKQPKGEATVTYISSDCANVAIDMFNGQDFNGYGPINVQIASVEQKYPFATKQQMAQTPVNKFVPSDTQDCIFIDGLPRDLQKTQIEEFFSQAGEILTAKGTQRIFLFLHMRTKEPLGKATVTYQDPESAQRAIQMFDNQEFHGVCVNVRYATPTEKQPFAERLHYMATGERILNEYSPKDTTDCIFIAGLPKTIQKEEISFHFASAGEILHSKGIQRIFLFKDQITKSGKGEATVTYTNPDDAKKAIEMFNGKDFNGHGIIIVQYASPDQKNPFAAKMGQQGFGPTKPMEYFLPDDVSDCLFITGLPLDVTKDDIDSYFSDAGKIKIKDEQRKIFLFLNGGTKTPIGDATVTFQTADSASKAIEMFDQQTFKKINGKFNGPITVQYATPLQKNPFAEKQFMDGHRAARGRGGMQGGVMRGPRSFYGGPNSYRSTPY